MIAVRRDRDGGDGESDDGGETHFDRFGGFRVLLGIYIIYWSVLGVLNE